MSPFFDSSIPLADKADAITILSWGCAFVIGWLHAYPKRRSTMSPLLFLCLLPGVYSFVASPVVLERILGPNAWIMLMIFMLVTAIPIGLFALGHWLSGQTRRAKRYDSASREKSRPDLRVVASQ